VEQLEVLDSQETGELLDSEEMSVFLVCDNITLHYCQCCYQYLCVPLIE